jgi:DNA-binding MarR family transcriptional regulator
VNAELDRIHPHGTIAARRPRPCHGRCAHSARGWLLSKQPPLADDSRQIDLNQAPDRQRAGGVAGALTVASRVLDADLLEASRLHTADYHVLVLLSEQPEHALRMSELAAQATLTRSGLTRVVERLTRRGLVERTRSQSDGRGQVARLTKDGMRALVKAYPRHLPPHFPTGIGRYGTSLSRATISRCTSRSPVPIGEPSGELRRPVVESL